MTALHIVLEGGPLDGGARVLTSLRYPDLLHGQTTRPEEYDPGAPGDCMCCDGQPAHAYRFVGVSQAKHHELGHYAYVRPGSDA